MTSFLVFGYIRGCQPRTRFFSFASQASKNSMTSSGAGCSASKSVIIFCIRVCTCVLYAYFSNFATTGCAGDAPVNGREGENVADMGQNKLAFVLHNAKHTVLGVQALCYALVDAPGSQAALDLLHPHAAGSLSSSSPCRSCNRSNSSWKNPAFKSQKSYTRCLADVTLEKKETPLSAPGSERAGSLYPVQG